MKELDGKVAVVTGGSRGIGRAICVGLAAQGARVFINYSSNEDAAKETAQLCVEAGGAGDLLPFNVAESDSVDGAFESVKEQAGQIDLLVNNAGIASDGIFIRTKNEDWDRVIAVNLTGAFYCARAAAKIMMKARQGCIVNISSVVGEMGNAGQAAYVSSKSGIIGLTKSLARELSARNITVNAVAPGFIETDMTKDLNEKLREEHMKAIPLSRYGAPEDIAGIVRFLAGPSATYITGQVVGVNGGMYM